MTVVKGLSDYNVQPLYDTVVAATANFPQLTAFQNGIGAGVGAYGVAAQAKTKADTNLNLNGQLPAGFRFLLIGFRLAMGGWNIVDADFKTVLNGAVFEFSVAQKSFLTVPATTVPGGNGPFGTASSLNNNGYPTLANLLGVGDEPLPIESNMNFSVTITWYGVTPTITQTGYIPTPGLPLRVYLDGKLARPVQ